eukprot:s2396_g3.t2
MLQLAQVGSSKDSEFDSVMIRVHLASCKDLLPPSSAGPQLSWHKRPCLRLEDALLSAFGASGPMGPKPTYSSRTERRALVRPHDTIIDSCLSESGVLQSIEWDTSRRATEPATGVHWHCTEHVFQADATFGLAVAPVVADRMLHQAQCDLLCSLLHVLNGLPSFLSWRRPTLLLYWPEQATS